MLEFRTKFHKSGKSSALIGLFAFSDLKQKLTCFFKIKVYTNYIPYGKEV